MNPQLTPTDELINEPTSVDIAVAIVERCRRLGAKKSTLQEILSALQFLQQTLYKEWGEQLREQVELVQQQEVQNAKCKH
jgi:predicted nuclease with TOPRIM domain